MTHQNTVTITAKQYLTKVQLGYYTPTRCISVFKKEVLEHNINSSIPSTKLIINILNQ